MSTDIKSEPHYSSKVDVLGSTKHEGLTDMILTPLALWLPILIKVPRTVVFPPRPNGPIFVWLSLSVIYFSSFVKLHRFPYTMDFNIREDASKWDLPIPIDGIDGVQPKSFKESLIHIMASLITVSKDLLW